MATIRGLFPPTGFNAKIGPDDVDAAMARHYRPEQYQHAPVALGGDVSRQGADASVLARRQGIVSFPLRAMRIPDIMLVSAPFSMESDERKAAAIFVAEPGGSGAGVSAAIRRRGYRVIGLRSVGHPRVYSPYEPTSDNLQ